MTNATVYYRMVAKDSYQTRVIVDLLQHFNWTYIAVVYADNEYERNLAKSLRKEIRKRKTSELLDIKMCLHYTHFLICFVAICIAYMPVIDDLANMSTIEHTLIQQMDKVKAIVAIAGYSHLSKRFLKTVEQMSAVLIFVDHTIAPQTESGNNTIGSFFVTFQRYTNPHFVMWYNNLTASVRAEYADCKIFNIFNIISPNLFSPHSEAIVRNRE